MGLTAIDVIAIAVFKAISKKVCETEIVRGLLTKAKGEFSVKYGKVQGANFTDHDIGHIEEIANKYTVHEHIKRYKS